RGRYRRRRSRRRRGAFAGARIGAPLTLVRSCVHRRTRRSDEMSLNLATMLRESALAYPDKPVALYDGGRLSYAQLDALSDRFATGLRASGVVPGESVGLQLPNIPQFLIAYFGMLKAGCIGVPLNVLLKAPEVAYCLGDAQARALVTWAGVADEAIKGAAAAGVPAVYVLNTPGVPEFPAARRFEELLAVGPETPPLEQTDPGDTALIVYTSGTTGTPKGAELTHYQLYMNADTPGRLFGIRDDDVVLVVLPLFHVFGLSSQLNVCVRFGATMSLVPRFDVTKVLEVMQRDGVTVFEGVPTMYVALLQHPNLAAYDVSKLRVGVSGGAPIPAEVLDSFEEKFGIVILEGYGLTETASTTTFNVSAEERRIYSVGKPIWGVEVQIWDDDNRPLPAGSDHVGEIVIRGGNIVYPREIEEVLYAHPAVAHAAVVGVPDERLGEEIKAYVETKPGTTATEQELIEYVKTRVAAYKYPRMVEFRADLPKGPTGKILKKEL